MTSNQTITPTTASLRQRQAALGRQAVLDALLRHLEAGDADEVSIEDLAAEAGVSRRTLYRYFPNRSALLEAAGEWIRRDVLELPIEIGPEGITGSFIAAAERLSAQPGLARALLRTETGRAVRGTYREARVESIQRALRAEAPGADEAGVARAAAVVSYLCSSNAWVTMQDESGLDAEDARAAVVWAIETLLERLK